MTRIHLVPLALSGLFYLLQPSAALATGIDEAIKDYQSRNYPQALSKLRDLSGKPGQPQDKIHYYMALCYQGTNQMSQAKGEYNWVYANSKDNTLRYNAYQALQGMERWSAHRSYEGQGNTFDRHSPANTRASQVAAARVATQKKEELEAQLAGARTVRSGSS